MPVSTSSSEMDMRSSMGMKAVQWPRYTSPFHANGLQKSVKLLQRGLHNLQLTHRPSPSGYLQSAAFMTASPCRSRSASKPASSSSAVTEEEARL